MPCLKRAGINTVEELTNRTSEDMMKVRNLGRKSLDEVLAKLKALACVVIILPSLLANSDVTCPLSKAFLYGKRVKEVKDGKKVTVYDEVEKEIKKDMPSRLHARRQMLRVLYPVVSLKSNMLHVLK